MSDEPEKKSPIQNKYAQQYADDLAANRKEQGVITAQIADLQERLEQLKAEATWLAQAQGSLPLTPVPSEPGAGPAVAVAETASADRAEQSDISAPSAAVAKAPQTVPQPRQDGTAKAEQPKQSAKKVAGKKSATAKKTAAKKTAKKTVARKAAAEKPAAEQAAAPEATAPEVPAKKTAAEEKSGPPLWQLVLDILLRTPGQPCVAREVHDQLAQDHPSRKTTVQTVRNNLETLVRKNLAEKTRQQGSSMYTAEADAAPAADATADSETEQAPETGTEKVPAEV
ncbi:BlaI/MecI/CopY family transcriptional regulator [Streptomyces sp. NPDC028722]|uniref:BlaI/MecI/CopY family transcriptional regulator n=1 Tax=Streptomyces sp. NPDC028722 TaxID=3155016 RepID=UPI0033E24D67